MTAWIRTLGGGRELARPIPEGTVAPPRYRWPSQKHLTPRRCANCGAALLRTDVPTAEAPVVDVACLLCTRVACELIADRRPEPPRPEPLPSSACRDCGARPGRSCYAGRCSPCERQANRKRPCIDCGGGKRLPYGRRCQHCQHEWRRAKGW
jgi:hypothetical protein